jgi:TonB-linked SusC/RagA family outer membrane protein
MMKGNTLFSDSRRRLICLPFCLFFLALFTAPGFAQQTGIQGRIISAQDGEALPGVSVQIKGTTEGVVTDAAGKFSLSVPAGATLHISFVGYETQDVQVGTRKQLLVKLAPTTTSLNQLVVVGYGTEKKANLTGAISTLDMTEKKGQPITNASTAMYGMPGLYVNLTNSQPGVDRASILIRGMGTLSSNDPLVLVNGVEYSMDEINPNDIATITVLKDASAAIYGSRAANGVILITTKKGSGKAHVNYSYYYGVQQPTILPDAIWDPITYMNLMNQAAANEGKTSPYFTDAQIQQYKDGMKTDPFDYPSINWFKHALKNGIIQKHDLSVSGSTDKYSYRLSLGYLNQDGIEKGPGNQNHKYYIGLNTTMHITSKLTAGITLNGNYRDYTEPSYTNGSFWNYLMRSLPIMPDTLKDGNWGYPWLRVPGRNNWENPSMIEYSGSYKKIVQQFLTTLHATYELPFGLSYHVKFGISKYDGLLSIFIPQMVKEQALTGKMMNWNSPTTAPRAEKVDYYELDLHFYNTLNWQHTFAGKHNVSAMFGASFDNYKPGSFEAEMTGYLDATLTALQSGSIFEKITGKDTYEAMESYFGRVNYNYEGKYLLEGIFRTDGSSRFAAGHRWGFFPGVSAGWRIDKEPFFKGVDFVDMLKLRASVGQLGDYRAMPLYGYQSSVTLGHNYSFGGPNGVLASGAAITDYADPTTSWETTTDYDLGLDVALLKDHLNLTLDLYKKWTTGILETVNLPAHVGDLGGPTENVGTVSNMGYEVGLKYHNHAGDFHYSVSGDLSYNKNKVIDLGGQILYGYATNLSTITEAGHPIDAFYVLDAVGIFQSDAEVAKSATQSNDTKAGYLKYRDVNNDGIINGDDRIIINSSSRVPKYNYSFGFNVGYKGVSLSAYFQGTGRFYEAPTANLAYPLNNGAGATWKWATDSWTPDRPDAKLPIITEANYGSKENYQPSTFWLQNAAYLRLKNITLSYELPQAWLSKIKISSISVYVNAQNWLTFTKFDEGDPEAIYNASSLYHYPMLKTINGGVNVSF